MSELPQHCLGPQIGDHMDHHGSHGTRNIGCSLSCSHASGYVLPRGVSEQVSVYVSVIAGVYPGRMHINV